MTDKPQIVSIHTIESDDEVDQLLNDVRENSCVVFTDKTWMLWIVDGTSDPKRAVALVASETVVIEHEADYVSPTYEVSWRDADKVLKKGLYFAEGTATITWSGCKAAE